MMVLMGGWWVITGLVGLFNSEFYAVTLRWNFQFDISTWAWIHLIGGIIILMAAFAWLPYYPIWAILFIVISIGVI